MDGYMTESMHYTSRTVVVEAALSVKLARSTTVAAASPNIQTIHVSDNFCWRYKIIRLANEQNLILFFFKVKSTEGSHECWLS